VRPAAISSIAFFDKKLGAPCTVAGRSTEFPKKSGTGNFRQIYPDKVPLTGIYAGKLPVQKCKTVYGAWLLPPIGRSLP
jgi:hypothetical protein